MRTVHWILAALPLLFFGWVAFPHLDRPGLYMDEMIFVDAAVGGQGGGYVFRHFHGIPTWIMPYIGALKSWIYAPVFAVWGVNPWTVRIPTLLLSLVTIVLGWRFVTQRLGKGPGLVTLWLLATDPAFLFLSRTDYGPTVLMNFLKMLALVSFFAWLERPSFVRLWSCLLALLLGLWDKLNFFWFFGAFGLSAVLFYRDEVWSSLRRSSLVARLSLAPFAFCLSVMLYALWYVLTTFPASSQPTAGIWSLLCSGLDGSFMRVFQFSGMTLNETMPPPLLVAGLLGFGVMVWRVRTRGNEPCRFAWFVLVCFVLIFVQAWITRRTGGAHHLIMLWPLPLILTLTTAVALSRSTTGRARQIVHISAAAVLGMTLATHVERCWEYKTDVEAGNRFNPLWAPEILELSKRIEAARPDVVIVTDWGMGSQLFSLAPSSRRRSYRDYWPHFAEMKDDAGLERDILAVTTGKRCIYVLHARGTTVMPRNYDNALHFFERNCPSRQKQVIGSKTTGAPLFELYVVDGR